ncbi:MAG: glycosyltransferase family 4 protein [Chthoniobacteraceae bacterium]
MKILVVCYEYPPIGGGGGRVAQTVAQELVKRGHQVRVQTAALGWKSSFEVVNGVEVFRTASGRKVPDTCSVPEMGAFVATSFPALLRQIWTWKPDVVHAHFAMPSGVLAWAAKILTHKPYVLTAHLGDVPGGVPEQTDKLFRIVGPVAREVWRHSAGATAVSSFVQELAVKAYGGSVVRIVNGIDLADAPPKPAVVGKPPHLVFLGRFNPQKNAPLLIEALSSIRDLDWRLTMIGDGPDMPAVKDRVAAASLQERVALAGWKSAADVHEILRQADILCMPSSAEGMPVAAIEALKHGLALITTDIPGLRDVVAPGRNGLQSSTVDAAAYADVLRSALSDPSRLLAMRRASWEKAREFALPAIIDRYEQVLQTAAASR